jgi:F0F1-type ATP synthase membrane subunit b/b'
LIDRTQEAILVDALLLYFDWLHFMAVLKERRKYIRNARRDAA